MTLKVELDPLKEKLVSVFVVCILWFLVLAVLQACSSCFADSFCSWFSVCTWLVCS